MAKTCKKYIRKPNSDAVLVILKDQANIMYIIIDGEFVKFVFMVGDPQFKFAVMRDIYRALDKKKFGKAKDTCFVRISSIINFFMEKQNLIVVMDDNTPLTVAGRKITALKAKMDNCPTVPGSYRQFPVIKPDS